MDKIKYFFYVLIQCTWGILQTMLGLILFIKFIDCRRSFYRGCVRIRFNDSFSVSLGLFIFVSNKCEEEVAEKLTVHEYGHTIQSLILGPLYLIVIGIPSFVWCRLPYFQRKRRDEQLPYASLWIERWANWLGEKFTGELSTRNML